MSQFIAHFLYMFFEGETGRGKQSLWTRNYTLLQICLWQTTIHLNSSTVSSWKQFKNGYSKEQALFLSKESHSWASYKISLLTVTNSSGSRHRCSPKDHPGTVFLRFSSLQSHLHTNCNPLQTLISLDERQCNRFELFFPITGKLGFPHFYSLNFNPSITFYFCSYKILLWINLSLKFHPHEMYLYIRFVSL